MKYTLCNMFPFNFRKDNLVCERYMSALQKQRTLALDWMAPFNMLGT